MGLSALTTTEGSVLFVLFSIEICAGFLLWKWLWSSGRVSGNRLSSEQRIRCYFLVLLFLGLLLLMVTVGGVLSHFDRPWYSVQNVTGGQFTFIPAHYYIFLTCYPGYVVFGGAIYIVLRNWLPDLLPMLKVPWAISVFVPFVFVPAIDGNLLDFNITLLETAYITFYWVANFVWFVFGILPLAYSIFMRLMENVGPS